MRVGIDDVLTAGAKRCEAVAPPEKSTALPIKQEFWYAISLRSTDGRFASDDQVLTQWHANGFNPFMGLYLKDGKLRIELRYNANVVATQANSTVVVPWRDTEVMTDKWSTYVFRAKISPNNADAPFIQVWRDGKLIVDRKGPLGYNTSEFHYAKAGLYHWVNNTNIWDARYPVRTVFINRAVTAKEHAGLYSEAVLRAMVQ